MTRLLMVLCTFVAGLATYLHGPGRVSPALAARMQAAPKLLFSAKFTRGFSTAVPGFTAGKGVLSYDGSADTALIVPFSTKHHANFAVQAVIKQRGSTRSDAPLVGYGITVRQSSSNPDAGIYAGSFFSQSDILNAPLILWAGDSVGGAQFSPGTSWRTYRLEVRGTVYRLFIDKVPVVSFTIPNFRSNTQIGIFSGYVSLQVKSFKVYSLSSAGARPAALPPVKSLGLQPADVPAGFDATLGHYFTNQELARELNTTESTLQAGGRLISYATGFENASATSGMFSIESEVTAYGTAASAQAAFTATLAADRSGLSGAAGVSSVKEQTLPSLGDSATLFTIDYSVQGQAYREYRVQLLRGAYHALISASFTAGGDAAAETGQVTSLAAAVDGRIKSAG